MKVTFVHMGAESLGIEYLSSCLKQKGHETTLVFDAALFNDQRLFNSPKLANLFNKKSRIIEKVVRSRPDLVAFSVFTNNYLWACDLAKRIKKEINVPIIFGGIHATSCPEEVIKEDFVDVVCIGEGEDAIVELVESLKNGEMDHSINNLWFKKDGKIIRNPIRKLVDADSAPFPDKRLFEKDISFHEQYIIMTSRRCPFNCTYCSNNYLRTLYTGKGKYLTRRSIKNVIDELKAAKKRYNPKEIIFYDDVFVLDAKWLEDFLGEYKREIGIPYRCLLHPNYLTEEIVLLLKRTNCVGVQFGVQSINEDTRKNILKRYETNEKLREIFALCDKHKLEYNIDHIFGLPFESEKDWIKAAEFYVNCKSCTKINNFWLSYFPGVEITDFALKHGLLTEKEVEDIKHGRIGNYFDKGDVKDKKLIRVCKNLSLLYELIPVLPRSVSRWIIKNRHYRFFYIISPVVGLPIRFISMVKCRDKRLFNYIKYYLHHIKKNLFGV